MKKNKKTDLMLLQKDIWEIEPNSKEKNIINSTKHLFSITITSFGMDIRITRLLIQIPNMIRVLNKLRKKPNNSEALNSIDEIFLKAGLIKKKK